MGLDTPSRQISSIAQAFVTARRDARGLPQYPGIIPATLADGYAVQDAAIALHGATIGGWKVGKINPPVESVNRLVGPIFADTIVAAGDPPPALPIFTEGFGAAEAEFLLRVGAAPEPGKSNFTRGEAIALIDAVHVGIEVASSPFSGINDHGPIVTVSDFGNNNGLVIGEPIADWRSGAFEAWPVELRINGESIGTGTGKEMLDGPLGAARFLFGLLAERGIAIAPGAWISSGAVTGVHPVGVGDRVEAVFNGRQRVECSIKAA